MSIQYSVNYAPNGVSQRISLIEHSFFLKTPNKSTQPETNQRRAMTGLQMGSWFDYQETFIPFLVWLFTSDVDFKLETALYLGLLCQLFPSSVLVTWQSSTYGTDHIYIYIFIASYLWYRHILYYLFIKIFHPLYFYLCRLNMLPKSQITGLDDKSITGSFTGGDFEDSEVDEDLILTALRPRPDLRFWVRAVTYLIWTWLSKWKEANSPNGNSSCPNCSVSL